MRNVISIFRPFLPPVGSGWIFWRTLIVWQIFDKIVWEKMSQNSTETERGSWTVFFFFSFGLSGEILSLSPSVPYKMSQHVEAHNALCSGSVLIKKLKPSLICYKEWLHFSHIFFLLSIAMFQITWMLRCLRLNSGFTWVKYNCVSVDIVYKTVQEYFYIMCIFTYSYTPKLSRDLTFRSFSFFAKQEKEEMISKTCSFK